MRGLPASLCRNAVLPIALIGAGFAALPSAGLALPEVARSAPEPAQAGRFTPANVDPALAERVASRYAAARREMRFTPATGDGLSERVVKVAVRVDQEAARAISMRKTPEGLTLDPGRRVVAIAPTQFDLGIARGYQSFSKPATVLPDDVARIAMPDLSHFRAGKDETRKSRFQTRESDGETDSRVGRSARAIDSVGNSSVDLGGSYRLSRNLDVTAGVRLSQDRARLAPLTNGVEDDKAIYLGTELRF